MLPSPHRMQGINRATNAFLKRALGDKYSAILVGIMGMPKVSRSLCVAKARRAGGELWPAAVCSTRILTLSVLPRCCD